MSRSPLRLPILLCLALALAVGLTACGSDDKPKKPAYCADATQVREDVDAFKDTKLSLTVVDELQDKFDALRASVKTLRTSAGDQFRPQLDAVNAALTTTGDTLSSMSSTSAIPAGLAALPGNIDQVKTSVSTLVDDVDDGCK